MELLISAPEGSPAKVELQMEPLTKFELELDTPLSRSRISTGAKWLAPTALLAAAEAFRRAGNSGDPLADDDDVAQQLIASAAALIVGDDAEATRIGARTIAAVAASKPHRTLYAASLVLHPDPDVRAVGAREALLDEHMLTRLGADPSPRVRAAVATRGSALPEPLRERLAGDPSASVRHVLRHADDEDD